MGAAALRLEQPAVELFPKIERFLTEIVSCCFNASVDVTEAGWDCAFRRLGGGNRRIKLEDASARRSIEGRLDGYTYCHPHSRTA
jgi:hypothetical protein